jgi:Na+/H+ antiporter NhaA
MINWIFIIMGATLIFGAGATASFLGFIYAITEATRNKSYWQFLVWAIGTGIGFFAVSLFIKWLAT